MKANELRIFNYVHATTAGNVGVGLVVHKIMDGADIDNAGWYFEIPLTEEWLIKFGFEQMLIEWWAPGFCLETYGDKIYYSGGEGLHLGMDLKYVHQLQNLYFALTGKELEIKL